MGKSPPAPGERAGGCQAMRANRTPLFAISLPIFFLHATWEFLTPASLSLRDARLLSLSADPTANMWYTRPLYELFVFAFFSHPLLGHSLISRACSRDSTVHSANPMLHSAGRDGFLCMNLGGPDGISAHGQKRCLINVRQILRNLITEYTVCSGHQAGQGKPSFSLSQIPDRRVLDSSAFSKLHY